MRLEQVQGACVMGAKQRYRYSFQQQIWHS